MLQRRVLRRTVVSELVRLLPRVRLDTHDTTVRSRAGQPLLRRPDDTEGGLRPADRWAGYRAAGWHRSCWCWVSITPSSSSSMSCSSPRSSSSCWCMGRGAVATARGESTAKYEVAGALEELTRGLRSRTSSPELRSSRSARLAELSAGYIEAPQQALPPSCLRQLLGAVTLHAVAGDVALLTLGGWLVIQRAADSRPARGGGAHRLRRARVLRQVRQAARGVLRRSAAAADKLGTLIDLPLEDDRGESCTRPSDHGRRSWSCAGVSYGYRRWAQARP